MSRSVRRRQRWLVTTATIFVAASGCTDNSLLAPSTAPRAAKPGNVGGGGGGGGQQRLSIVAVNLASSSLIIGGASVSYTVTVQNRGGSVSNVSLQGAIVQGPVSQPAGGFAANCLPPSPGVVPKGSCQMTFTTSASNANGGGTLVPGPASFVLTMSVDAGGVSTVMDQESVPVTLAGGGTLGITSLELDSPILAIGGAGVPYDVIISNPGSQLNEVFIQGEMLQNDNLAGAAGSNVLCPPTSANAVLPVGTCMMEWIAVASNQSYGPAPLVPGAATFRLTLYQGFESPVVLDTRSIAVTLVAGPPEVTGVIFLDTASNVLLSTTVGTDYNVTLVNSGADMIGMTLKGQVVQTLNGVNSTRNVSDVPVTCPSNSSGALPNGVCTFQVTAIVSNSASGSGPDLVPENDAMYVVTLYQNGVEVASTSRVIHLKVQLL